MPLQANAFLSTWMLGVGKERRFMTELVMRPS